MDAIVLHNVAKHFRRRTLHHTTMKSELMRWVRREHRAVPATITQVLHGINLSVPRGTTLGIIGRNGSGKSTLLKLITGIYSPTSGKVAVDGRISALLELGAGFHPDFSGRENILINGIILGMSRSEIRTRMPEIIGFSELGNFIDEPVRTYSSGMFMRLAFAVATHVDPDILVIDEILAVGDSHFARKSRAKMDEFKELKKTIVLVTHDLATVERWCDQAIWIDEGRVVASGEPQYVVDQYRRAVANAEAAGKGPLEVGQALAVPLASEPPPSAGGEGPRKRWGTFRVELTRVRIVGPDGSLKAVFSSEEALSLQIDFECKTVVGAVSFHVTVFRSDGLPVWDTTASSRDLSLPVPLPMHGSVELILPRLGLSDGDYLIDVGLFASEDGCYYDFHKSLYHFSVRSPGGDFGVVKLRHFWRSLPEQSAADLTSGQPVAYVRGES